MQLQGASPSASPPQTSQPAPGRGSRTSTRAGDSDVHEAAAGLASPEVSDTLSTDPELKLLQEAQTGNRGAFGEFVLSTQDRLYTLLVRIVGDREEARELAQETYLKALGGLSKFRGASAGYTWLYRIGVNLAIARLRKVRRQRTFSLEGLAGGVPSADRPDGRETPAEQLESRERARAVMAALGRLDSEYRAVLVMRDVDGLDYKDISEVLGLPLGTVKSRLFRARLALRDELNRYMAPPPNGGTHGNGDGNGLLGGKGVWS